MLKVTEGKKRQWWRLQLQTSPLSPSSNDDDVYSMQACN